MIRLFITELDPQGEISPSLLQGKFEMPLINEILKSNLLCKFGVQERCVTWKWAQYEK